MKRSKHEDVRFEPAARLLTTLRVMRTRGADRDGRRVAFLLAGGVAVRCALGRAGVTRAKREGDGKTPLGRFRILSWRFQPVRPAFHRGALPGRTIRRRDGWCDDPARGAYNRQVVLPFAGSHETLWRDDGKYAVVGVLDFNIRPMLRGGGSAIFFHICDPDYAPTAGCVAIRAADLRKLLPRLSPRVAIRVD